MFGTNGHKPLVVVNKSATYISHPTTGLIFKSDELWKDPPTALRNNPNEFRLVKIEGEPEDRQTDLLSLQHGEWVRYEMREES